MKKFLAILVLGLLVCSASFAEKYPELKSPLVSIAGKTPKKLKVPGKINLKNFIVNKSGSRIYMDINERQKKLKKFKDKARLCRLENNFAAKVKNNVVQKKLNEKAFRDRGSWFVVLQLLLK